MIKPRLNIVEKVHSASILEAVENFHLSSGLLNKILKPLLSKPLYKFACMADEYDLRIERDQLPEATKWFLKHFITSLKINGQENIPQDGPLLIVPNHAGGVDFLTMMASITRKDFRVIANNHAIIDPLTFLPNHLLFIGNDTNDRSATIFSVLDELKKGHSVLVFPAGLLEPDPKLIPGAQDHLEYWSSSLGIFVKKIPNLKILPVVIGGTVSPSIYNSIFAKIRRNTKKRAKTAILMQYMLQLMWPGKIPLDIEVTIGKPILREQLPFNAHPKKITNEIINQQKGLMQTIYADSSKPLKNWYQPG
jgi:1-acyl-sn-glycerol-3-phosphate acyltransferase